MKGNIGPNIYPDLAKKFPFETKSPGDEGWLSQLGVKNMERELRGLLPPGGLPSGED